MLQDFRDNLKGITTWILVAIIIVPFALFGVDSLFLTGSAVNEVASVNGEGITELQLQQAIDIRKRQLLDQYEQLTPDLLDDEQLRGPVLDSLIRQKVMVLAAEDQGMTTPQKMINDIIVGSSAFHNDGRFDPDMYAFNLRRMGYTSKSYRDILSSEILAEQFVRGVAGTSFITGTELDELIRIREQGRDYAYLTLPLAPLLDSVEVGESEVTAFYDDHPERFQVPEQVVVEYLELKPEFLFSEIELDESLVRQQYDQEVAALSSTVQKRVAHILVNSDDSALVETIQKELDGGADFSELAKKYSTDFGSAEQGGELGVVTPGTFPEAFEQALDELEVGQVSAPVRTDSGFHFIKLLESSEVEAPAYADEKARIANNLRRQQALELLPEKIEQMKELAYNVSSLESTADAMGLQLQVSEPFSRSGGTGPLASIPQAVRAAFSDPVLVNGYSSDVLELSEEHFLVLKLRESRPAHRQPLAEVRDQIVASVRRQKASAQLAIRAEELQEKVVAGASIESIAAAENLEWQERDDVKRYLGQDDPRLVDRVFSHTESENLPKSGLLTTAGGDYVVYTLKAINPGDTASVSEAERNALADSMAGVAGDRELQAYVTSLQASADIARKQVADTE